MRKSYLKDVKLEFSPVYWIENGTFVPTTTTTTSTTTLATTSTGDPKPMHAPPVVHLSDVGHSNSREHSMGDSPNIHNNEIPNEPGNYAENMKHTKPGSLGDASSDSKSNKSPNSASARYTTFSFVLISLLTALATINFN